MRAPNYIDHIDTGRLDPTAVPAVTDETDTIAQIDGGNTFGQVTAKMATELAISKAREQGVALVTMYRIGHTGRLGTYAEMAAEAGMASVLWDGVIGGNRSIVIPLYGSGRKIGANPIAMGFPSEKHNAVVLDFATSISAAGKVAVAEAKRCALAGRMDRRRRGTPTDDPTQLNKGGALRPMGLPDVGHKGYALAMMTGLFTMMASMPSGAEMPHEDRWGTVILMVDISRFGTHRTVQEAGGCGDRLCQDRSTGWRGALPGRDRNASPRGTPGEWHRPAGTDLARDHSLC